MNTVTLGLTLTLLCIFGSISSESFDDITEKYNIYLEKINDKYGTNLTLINIGRWSESFASGSKYRFLNIDSMMMNERGKDNCMMLIHEKQTMNYVRVDIECIYFGFRYSFESLNIITDPKQLAEFTKEVQFYLEKINEQNKGVQLQFNRSHLATTQTFYGELREMIAEINENDQVVSCKIKLWEQTQMNYARMDVECGEEKHKYAFEQPGVYLDGYHDLDEKQLQMLNGKLSPIFNILQKQYADFRYTLKRLVNGKQHAIDHIDYIVKHFIVTAEATNKANEVKQCHSEFYLDRFSNYKPMEIECGERTFRYTPL